MAAREEMIKDMETLLLKDPDNDLIEIRYRADPEETILMIFTTGEVIQEEIAGWPIPDILWEIIDTVYA